MKGAMDGLAYFWPALLQVLAFGVVIGEILLPSLGLLSLLSLGLFAYSWIWILGELPGWAAWTYGGLDIALAPFAVKFAFRFMGKSTISHRSDLGRGSGLEELDRNLARHIGQEAVVEMPLRPSGKIRLGNDVLDAVSDGSFLDRGARVRVVSVSGSRIQVEAA